VNGHHALLCVIAVEPDIKPLESGECLPAVGAAYGGLDDDSLKTPHHCNFASMGSAPFSDTHSSALSQ
jgi:hypothetical protein